MSHLKCPQVYRLGLRPAVLILGLSLGFLGLAPTRAKADVSKTFSFSVGAGYGGSVRTRAKVNDIYEGILFRNRMAFWLNSVHQLGLDTSYVNSKTNYDDITPTIYQDLNLSLNYRRYFGQRMAFLQMGVDMNVAKGFEPARGYGGSIAGGFNWDFFNGALAVQLNTCYSMQNYAASTPSFYRRFISQTLDFVFSF